MNITQTIFMLKLFRTNPLLRKSIGKFWILTSSFILILLVLKGILPKIYNTVYSTLKWDAYIPFLLVTFGFGLLIWKIFKTDRKPQAIQWKPWDAIILACCIYSSQTLEFVAIDSLGFLFEESLLFTFVTLSCFYFLIKIVFWSKGLRMPKRIDSSEKNQQNQDQSLENTKGFENIKDLNKLKELDKLGRFDHAQQISHVINNIEPEKSFAIGINGEWGSGKTSFIHLVRKINQIEHPNQYRFIIFNPWYFTGTEKVLIKFHEALLSEIGHFSLSFRNELHRYFQLICTMETSIWKTNFLQYFQKQTDFQSQLEKLRGYFEKLPQKIVIIIDDMDRLQKDEILVLFRTMRLIADFPNVVYLVGYDPEYIKTMLGEISGDNKSSFMEKVFQVQFDLPDPLPSDLITFWEEAIKDFIPKDKSGLQKRIIDNIVINQIIPNLRDIKRFLNQFSINYSLPEIKSNTYLPQFFLLELIYYTDPTIYYKIHTFKIYNFESTEDVKIEKQSTIVITKQIKALAANDERSITKEKHFEKYFFKRLDKINEIDYKDVEDILEDEYFEKEIETLYFKNKTHLIDHMLYFINCKKQSKDPIDKTLAIKYLDRILYLLEFSYNSERLDKNPFDNGIHFSGKRLINGISNMYDLFEVDREKSFIEFRKYLTERIELNCFSYLILNLDEKLLGNFTNIFRNRIKYIASQNQTNKDNINHLPLLFDLYNFQQLLSKLTRQNSEQNKWIHDSDVLNGIRTNIKSISDQMQMVIQAPWIKDLNIFNFFGTKENVLALNDMKDTDIFDFLDKEIGEYPIHQEVSIFEFTHTFEYSKYNCKINLPESINQLIIKSVDGKIIHQLDFSDDNVNVSTLTLEREPIKLSKSIDNYSLIFYRSDNGCLLSIKNFSEREIYNDLINPYPNFKCDILIMTNNAEDFIVSNQLRDSKIQDKIEAKILE